MNTWTGTFAPSTTADCGPCSAGGGHHRGEEYRRPRSVLAINAKRTIGCPLIHKLGAIPCLLRKIRSLFAMRPAEVTLRNAAGRTHAGWCEVHCNYLIPLWRHAYGRRAELERPNDRGATCLEVGENDRALRMLESAKRQESLHEPHLRLTGSAPDTKGFSFAYKKLAWATSTVHPLTAAWSDEAQ